MSQDIVFPKKWKELSEEDQKEWIKTQFMPKTVVPEPILTKKTKVKEGTLKLENGTEIEFPIEPIIASRSNPNIVRVFEFWVGNWLMTVFYDKAMPHVKYLGVSNPSKGKWIAQELSHEILSKLFTALFKIGNKFRLFRRKSFKTARKKDAFTISLRDNKG
jgi:hypothetical protein